MGILKNTILIQFNTAWGVGDGQGAGILNTSNETVS